MFDFDERIHARVRGVRGGCRWSLALRSYFLLNITNKKRPKSSGKIGKKLNNKIDQFAIKI